MRFDPRQVTTIVFDVDGTLYGQRGLRRAMRVKLLREVLCHPRSSVATFRILRSYRRAQEILRKFNVHDDLASVQLRLASEHSGQPAGAVAETVTRWMDREPLALLNSFVEPALRRFLNEARRRGVRMGILSDYPAKRKLAGMRLAEFFDVVVSAQDIEVNRFKPHPAGLVETLRRLRATPSQSLYVGDRHEVDGAVASAVGVPCVIVGKRRNWRASDGWVPVSDYGQLYTMLFSSTRGLMQ